MTTPKYFSTFEAAKQYGLSRSWLAKLRVYGQGPAYIKVGRRVLYDASTFEQWLEQHRRNNTAED